MRLASGNVYSEYVPGLLLDVQRRAAVRARRRRQLRLAAWSFLLAATGLALIAMAWGTP